MTNPEDPSHASVALVDPDGTVVARVEVRRDIVDLDAVDALARLALAARRRGHDVRLVGACATLRGLVDLAGLEDVLRPEVGREAEVGEELRVEEVVEPGDPAP